MTAEIYGAAAGFKTYCDSRGIAHTSLYDDAINALLLVYSEWLDSTYRYMFPGTKNGGREQIREWPRIGVVDRYGNVIGDTEIPREVTYATYEAVIAVGINGETIAHNYTPSKYVQASVSGAVAVTFRRFDGINDTQTVLIKVEQHLSALLETPETNSLVGDVFRV